MFRTISLLAAALTFVSCERRSDIEIANEANILIIGNANEPKGLDPHLVSGVLESNIIRSLFEGLCIEHPSEDGKSLPGAAMSWEPSDDFTEWIFHLNPEGKWSDGVPVTAHDFVFSYRRMLSPDPNWPAKYFGMLFFLENAEAYRRNKLGHILCGNDPDFPISWEDLKESNFDGDDKITPSKFSGKNFQDLEENDLAIFTAYLSEGESISFEKLNAPDLDDSDLSRAEKKILFNHIGIDKLDEKRLLMVKDDPGLVKWAEGLSAENQQEVLDRIIAHHQAGKPDLWEKAQVGVTAVDDFTLKLNLRGPVPFLTEITKHYTWFPLPKHVVLEHGEINTAFSSQWTRPGNIVSNGPFQLKTWRTNHYLEVERNPHYWDAETVGLDGIRYLPIANYYTETRMYGDNQLHVTYLVPSELIPMAQEKYGDELRQEPYVGVRFLRTNTFNKPFDNPKVRRAFALAIDQQAICEKVLQGGQTPASGLVPPFGEYKPPKFIEFDPEKARALLAESGYESTSSFPEISLLTRQSESALREAEALQGMWEKHLGIKVRIVTREWTTYQQKQYDFDYDIVAAGWIGDYLDPTTFLELWITNGGNNNTGWGSQAFEDLLKKAENTADVPTRMKTLIEAEEVIMNDTPVLPIYFYTTNYLVRPEVQNWDPLLLNNHPFKFVRLKKP